MHVKYVEGGTYDYYGAMLRLVQIISTAHGTETRYPEPKRLISKDKFFIFIIYYNLRKLVYQRKTFFTTIALDYK